MSRFLLLNDLDLSGRRVLLRSDLNVPLADGGVADDYRLQAAIPTIERLRREGAVVVLCSHLGRPKGQVDEALRLLPVAEALAEIGGFEVQSVSEMVGSEAGSAVSQARPGDVVLLENTRFASGETTNDPALSAELAALADCFVMDAFGTAHRAHVSTAGVADHIRSAAGPLLAAELEAFRSLLENPPRPFTVVLGGAKISDKLPVINALLPVVDSMVIGGGMCFSLLAAEGFEVGESLVEPELIDGLRDVLASEHGEKISLPTDVVVADRFAEDARSEVVGIHDIDKDGLGLDIGPETVGLFTHIIGGSASVFWNGPMGVFEWEQFRAGTANVATAVAKSAGFTLAGGGDSVAALRLLGLDTKISHLSTGGGAGLKVLEGKALAGVAALEQWTEKRDR